MDLASMMADDSADAFRLPNEHELGEIASLVFKQLDLERQVAEKKEELERLKSDLAHVQERELPEVIERFGIAEVKMQDGTTVKVDAEVYAGITKENEEAAFKWLEDTQNDGLIKNEVTCKFGKGQDEEASGLLLLLSEKGYSYQNKRSVHPQTLKAFVKRRLEDGEPIPADVFSIVEKKVAKIALPKEKKR